MTIDPSFVTTTPEWQIDGVGRFDPVADEFSGVSRSEGFGEMLGRQVAELQNLQQDAATQAQALATGQAEDPTAVVMAVERAKLSMQLATQIRERGVAALQEVLRMQV